MVVAGVCDNMPKPHGEVERLSFVNSLDNNNCFGSFSVFVQF